jgi:hypothetical protein
MGPFLFYKSNNVLMDSYSNKLCSPNSNYSYLPKKISKCDCSFPYSVAYA